MAAAGWEGRRWDRSPRQPHAGGVQTQRSWGTSLPSLHGSPTPEHCPFLHLQNGTDAANDLIDKLKGKLTKCGDAGAVKTQTQRPRPHHLTHAAGTSRALRASLGSVLTPGSGLRPSRSSGPCQGDTCVYPPPHRDVMSQYAALRVGSYRALKIPLGTCRTQEAEGGPEVSAGGGHGSQTRCSGRLAMGMWGCVQGPPGHSKGMESTGNRHQTLSP